MPSRLVVETRTGDRVVVGPVEDREFHTARVEEDVIYFNPLLGRDSKFSLGHKIRLVLPLRIGPIRSIPNDLEVSPKNRRAEATDSLGRSFIAQWAENLEDFER